MTHDLTRFQGSFPAVVTPFRDGKVDIKAFEAFLDWLQAPESLRRLHRVWNGLQDGDLPELDAASVKIWAACARAARDRLCVQQDLLSQLNVKITEIYEKINKP